MKNVYCQGCDKRFVILNGKIKYKTYNIKGLRVCQKCYTRFRKHGDFTTVLKSGSPRLHTDEERRLIRNQRIREKTQMENERTQLKYDGLNITGILKKIGFYDNDLKV